MGPLTKRLALGCALTVAALCNKLGFMLVDKTAEHMHYLLAHMRPERGDTRDVAGHSAALAKHNMLVYALTCGVLVLPSLLAVLVRMPVGLRVLWVYAVCTRMSARLCVCVCVCARAGGGCVRE